MQGEKKEVWNVLNAVNDWVWNVTAGLFLGNLILQIVSGTCYQKYIRFFVGLLIMIVLAAPLGTFLGNVEDISEKLDQTKLWPEMERFMKEKEFPTGEQEKFEKDSEETGIENLSRGGHSIEVEPVRIQDH